MDTMMTVRELADFLGVHENWVYAHAMAGNVPSYKIGSNRRFRRSEIEAWLEQQRPAPPLRAALPLGGA